MTWLAEQGLGHGRGKTCYETFLADQGSQRQLKDLLELMKTMSHSEQNNKIFQILSTLRKDPDLFSVDAYMNCCCHLRMSVRGGDADQDAKCETKYALFGIPLCCIGFCRLLGVARKRASRHLMRRGMASGLMVKHCIKS